MRIRNEANLFPQNLHFFQRKGDDDDDDDDGALPRTHRRRRRREEAKEDAFDDASCCSRKGYFFVGKRGSLRRGEEEEERKLDDDDDDDDELERILRGVFQISSGRAERGWHRRWRKKKRFDRTDDKVRAELQLSRRRAVGFVFSEQWVALENACTIIRGRRLAKRDDEMDLEQHHVNNSITTTHFARDLRGSGGGFGNDEFFFLFFLARGVAGRVAFLGVVVFEIRVG